MLLKPVTEKESERLICGSFKVIISPFREWEVWFLVNLEILIKWSPTVAMSSPVMDTNIAWELHTVSSSISKNNFLLSHIQLLLLDVSQRDNTWQATFKAFKISWPHVTGDLNKLHWGTA